MNSKNYLLSIFIILVLIFVAAAAVNAEEVQRSPRFNINGITGDDFIGQAGILYPFQNKEDSLWYTDFRYRMSADDVDEWNLGLGYRYKLDNAENHVAGAYLFRDRREEYGYDWDMWTIGGEILTDQLDFRLNGYIAENDRVLAPDAVVGGNSVEVNNNRELVLVLGNEVYYTAMDGLDFEIGKRFTGTDSIFKNIGIYAKLYRFFESDTPTITGRQIRVDKQFGNINQITWKIGAKWMDDNVRGSETEATFTVSIPFGKGSSVEKDIKDVSPEDILEAKMTRQPERDLDVVIGKSVSENDAAGQEIIIENPALEESLKVWYVAENGNYDALGTKNDPVNLARIIDAEIGAQEGEIIVLSGRDGDIYLDFEDINYIEATGLAEKLIYRIELKDSQQLISKRGYALVEAEVAGELKQFEFKPDVPQATLVGAPIMNGMIIPSSNNVISGINLINKSTVSATIYPSVNGYLYINNNIFEFTEDDISEAYAILLFSGSSVDAETKDVDDTNNGFEINIVDNEFYNSTSASIDIAAVTIRNYSRNGKIIIRNNKIYNFKTQDYNNNSSAINIANLFTANVEEDNFYNIEDNTIENSNIAIFFDNYDSDNISSTELDDIKDYYKNKNVFNQINPEDEVKIEYNSDR